MLKSYSMVVVVCMNDEDGWSSHAKEASARPDIGPGAGPATSMPSRMPSRKRFVTTCPQKMKKSDALIAHALFHRIAHASITFPTLHTIGGDVGGVGCDGIGGR